MWVLTISFYENTNVRARGYIKLLPADLIKKHFICRHLTDELQNSIFPFFYPESSNVYAIVCSVLVVHYFSDPAFVEETQLPNWRGEMRTIVPKPYGHETYQFIPKIDCL